MTRNINGYTYQISEVEDGFQIVVTKPNGDIYTSHSYIRTYAIIKAHEIIDNLRRNGGK